MPEGEKFLHKKYSDLHTSESVEHEQARRKRAGEETTQKPAEKIADFLSVIERTHGHTDNPEVMQKIRDYYHEEYVINPEDVPESYFEDQKKIAREQGHGDIEITDEMKQEMTEVIITDQKTSLDTWIDYLTSEDAAYPMWLKYFAFRNVVAMGDYDKEKKQFTKRSETTVKPFPDLNREALAYVLDVIEKKAKKEKIDTGSLNPEEQEELNKLLQSENFAKLYAWAIEKVTPASQEALVSTKGIWKKYDQGSDHMPLVESLQGHGTGWCVAGEGVAQNYLKAGDFYVYYSYDEHGKPIIPRAAIQMNGDSIGQVRGIGPDQNLDPHIGDVVKQKLTEFPDGKLYEKKTADMKLLTEIDNKSKLGKEPGKDELVFLYEINQPIEGFGYQKDPRIAEIRETRDPKKDAPIVFECDSGQIAYKPEDINENTKAYIGPLFKGIFQLNIEHVCTSFPEGIIRKMETTIGGKDKKELLKELKEKKINISDYAKDMMENKDFTTSKKPEQIQLIRLTVGDLGLKDGATTKDIYERAEELGLELCSAETGPNLRINYENQPLGDWFRIAMKQITDRDGDLNVFYLARDDDGLWLRDHWDNPENRWHSYNKFVFRFRKLD